MFKLDPFSMLYDRLSQPDLSGCPVTFKFQGRWFHRICIALVLCLFFLGGALPAEAASVRGAKYSSQYTPPPSYSNADLAGQDFSGQTLRVAEFSNANLNRANFSNANLQGAVFSASTTTETNWHGADLTQAMMDQLKLSRVDLSDAILVDAMLLRTTFSEIKIIGADFTGAMLDRAQIRELCQVASGVNAKTGVETRESLGCEG